VFSVQASIRDAVEKIRSIRLLETETQLTLEDKLKLIDTQKNAITDLRVSLSETPNPMILDDFNWSLFEQRYAEKRLEILTRAHSI